MSDMPIRDKPLFVGSFFSGPDAFQAESVAESRGLNGHACRWDQNHLSHRMSSLEESFGPA